MKKVFTGVICLALCITLSAEKIKIESTPGKIWKSQSKMFKGQKMSSTVNSYNDGVLSGVTSAENNTHLHFYVTTEIFFYTSKDSVKPVYVYNIKKKSDVTGLERPSKVGWGVNLVKHRHDPSYPGWMFWKMVKTPGTANVNWNVDIADIAANAPYVEIRSIKALDFTGEVTTDYFNLGKLTVELADAVAKGQDPSTKINELVNYAAESLYIRNVTEDNAAEYKALLLDFTSMITSDIAPLIKNNKDDVKELVQLGIQLVTGDFNVSEMDNVINKLATLAENPDNTAQIKDMIEKLANILEKLNDLNVFRDKTIVENYVGILQNIADDITGDTLISEHNAVMIFDGLKIITRIAAKQDLNNVPALADRWFSNGLVYYLEKGKVPREQIDALGEIFSNSIAVAVKDNGKYINYIITVIEDAYKLVGEIQKGGSDISKIVVSIENFLGKHADFISDNKSELITIFENTKVFVPETQKKVIDLIIQFINAAYI